MENSYNPQQVEQQAQTYWQEKKCFQAKESLDKEAFYCLSMLPYPSGELHMGHVRNYTLGDVITRYQMMQGKQVLQPIGWDAFGLPAENAANQRGVDPKAWTEENIANMRNQLKTLGLGYDWSREITTCQPDYYRWNQWLFIQLYQKGLAYQKTSAVNWDPVDQTVLANEQVIDGKGWRSGAAVEQRQIKQWFFKTTAYADALLDDLDTLTDWPEEVKTMQRHWIGRSSGCGIDFAVEHSDRSLSVFTTRADTLMGATYLAISPEHPIAKTLSEMQPTIATFIKQCQAVGTAEANQATQQKLGIDSGLVAIHPLTQTRLPIWIANYVLMSYGQGAVMAVPAHDERDFEFATRYQLPIQPVIDSDGDLPYTGTGTLIHSGEFNGLTSEQAKTAITEALVSKQAGQATTHYRLRDWGISRQRYWGTPIPMIYCDQCGVVPVKISDLPVTLPDHIDPKTGLKGVSDFYHTTCPNCQGPATRETDTMDTFVDSSWYYLRYTCFDQHSAMLDDRARYWTPVDQYIGGIEHATMHLLYARFMHKALGDLDLMHSPEPFKRLLTQGMVLKDGFKMSKSKGNTVAPMPLIQQYGADTVRLFILFAAPPHYPVEWQAGGIQGAFKFLNKVWQQAHQWHPLLSQCSSDTVSDLSKERGEIHRLLKQANQDYERQQFNTVVSACMKLVHCLQSYPLEANHASLAKEALTILLKCLAPIAPHISHHLWQMLQLGGDLTTASWAVVDKRAIRQDTLTLMIQINGKKRGEMTVSSQATEADIRAQVENDTSIRHYLTQPIKRIIVVPGRLVNVVIG